MLLSWFEPLQEGDQAAAVTAPDPECESARAHLEDHSGAFPEYIEVEWTDVGVHGSTKESPPEDKNLTATPPSKIFAGA